MQHCIKDTDDNPDEVCVHIAEKDSGDKEQKQDESQLSDKTEKNEHTCDEINDTDDEPGNDNEYDVDTSIVNEHTDGDLERESSSDSLDHEDEHSGTDREATQRSIRKSTRTRRPPDRYGVAITHQQHAVSDWKDHVSLLVHIFTVFPHKSDDLYEHIMSPVEVSSWAYIMRLNTYCAYAYHMSLFT